MTSGDARPTGIILCHAMIAYAIHKMMCHTRLHKPARMIIMLVDSDGYVWSGWNSPVWCSGGRRPLIAGCLSLQRLEGASPVTRPDLRPPASESRSLAIELSEQLHKPARISLVELGGATLRHVRCNVEQRSKPVR